MTRTDYRCDTTPAPSPRVDAVYCRDCRDWTWQEAQHVLRVVGPRQHWGFVGWRCLHCEVRGWANG